MTVVRTQVGIVGAGPGGLLLAHLLAAAGVESVVIDSRSREEIEQTVRAGILEDWLVELLKESGASDRVTSDANPHQGIELRFDGGGHRIDFRELVGRDVWLYPQHEVLKDLIATLLAAGHDLRFGVSAQSAQETGELAVIHASDSHGEELTIEADFVVGADGSHSVVREAVTGSHNDGFFREYPFAWFGILCDAPPSSPELIYSNSPQGFALISQRSETVQRMYLQCDPGLDPNSVSEDQIWESLSERVAPYPLKDGPIFKRDVLRFRSFVASRLLNGRLALVGDAAHTVPPTGAKGMNLAAADCVVLASALEAFLLRGDRDELDHYPEVALRRIWKAQHFSWWMTSMLHTTPEASEFDRRRQLGELYSVVESEAGMRYLAEAYTGWPLSAVV